MGDQLRSGQFFCCAKCAEKAELIEKVSTGIQELSTGIQELAEKNKAEEERLDRIFLRIENCERIARELGLYNAKPR